MPTPSVITKLIKPFGWINPTKGNILGRERGQALLRVFVSAIVALYFLHAEILDNVTLGPTTWQVFSAYTIASFALFWHVLRATISPSLRRYFTNLADMSIVTYGLITAGEPGMPLFLFYLWVTLGNGFRYGITALLVSAFLGVVGFGIVVSTTDAWQIRPALAVGLFATLILLPLGAAHFVDHMNRSLISNIVSKLITPFKWLNPIAGNILGRERGQALLRVFVSTAVTLFTAYNNVPIGFSRGIPVWLIFALGYITLSSVLLWHILYDRSSSPLRHYFANLADMGAVSYMMIATGESGMPLFVLYFWITFGNGFRYGITALLVSAFLGVVGFGVVVSTTEAWRTHQALSTSVMLALIILPLYAAHLINQLNKALARAQDANAAKGQFLARMSHELRTPLNGVIGATELLETGRRLAPEDRSLLQVIRDSVQVSLRQIGNVLDFSKLEAGKLVLEHTDFDLHEVVNSSARMVRPAAVQKGLRLLVRIAPETPFRLVGDPHHLREVLLNLLSNAVKFTERGYVCLEVSGRDDTNPLATVRFDIHDTGIGIAPEALGRIFESFAQEDAGTTRRHGGTGLGTTIAKQLVELMGGRIGVESAKGRGSVFRLEIPLAKQAQDGAVDETLPGIRALLVSEDADVAGHYARIIEALGGQPTRVGSHDEAEQVLARAVRLRNPVHAVLMDAALDIEDRGAQRRGELYEKTASVNTPLILVSDIAPAAEQLRERGYSAVLARAAERRLVFTALHSSPLRAAAADRAVVSVAPWVWGRGPGVRRRVLAADDNRTNLMIVRRMLEQAGYDVDTAETGDQALERLCAGGYRIAILDLHMPGLDGLGVLRQYRLLRSHARVPVIVLTANASLEAQGECADAGADAYLTKPVHAADLLTEVERLLRETEVEAMAARMPSAGGAEDGPGAERQDVLDISVLAELDRLYQDPRELARVIQEYEREGRGLLERVAQACAARNHAVFCDQVHALKGNAANVGAIKLMQACREAEAAGIAEFLGNRAQLLASMRQAFAETLAALRDLVQTPLQGKRESADSPKTNR